MAKLPPVLLSIGTVDGHWAVRHRGVVSTLAEIERAASKLTPDQKRELVRFLGEQLSEQTKERAVYDRSPKERAADLKSWAATHKDGPGLPDSVIGRDTIYD